MTDSATEVTCDRHGPSSATFVCQHVANGVGVGLFTSAEDPDDPRPDAWCAACEAMVNAAGGWDERTEAIAGITLLCESGYDEARARNIVQTPSDADA
jgi:hypothetical protein